MPKQGMEPIRRKALIEATIRAIHSEGYCKVTIGAIAREAKVSTGLAHHYFGSKEQLLSATMRELYRQLGRDVREQLALAATPLERVSAIVRANLSTGQFRPEVVSAWLAFYMQAQTEPAAQHLLALYHSRMHSNLAHALGRLVAAPLAREIARDTGAMIDGYYLRRALGRPEAATEAAVARIEAFVARSISDAETPE
ncbi:transcriptional regulator BetI [Oceanicella sp. SM1341]|uniref:choline-binding transcriptional repressor BetI n=1 Tax=Oceanicella sp. SM1341 TaxID=1548889 RepID=UPI000E54765B|nr:transcriptional regulator BetI [Oceanicella sp. SM1341]